VVVSRGWLPDRKAVVVALGGVRPAEDGAADQQREAYEQRERAEDHEGDAAAGHAPTIDRGRWDGDVRRHSVEAASSSSTDGGSKPSVDAKTMTSSFVSGSTSVSTVTISPARNCL